MRLDCGPWASIDVGEERMGRVVRGRSLDLMLGQQHIGYTILDGEDVAARWTNHVSLLNVNLQEGMM